MTESAGKENALLFLDVCAKIEGMTADLYHFYSRAFNADREVSRLWKKTALEEENHYRQIRLALKMLDQVESLLLDDGLGAAYGIFHKLQKLVSGVKSNPPDLVTALKKSIEMEERLSFLHVDSSVRFKDESVQQMFSSLRAADREHVSALKRQLAIETVAFTEMRG